MAANANASLYLASGGRSASLLAAALLASACGSGIVAGGATTFELQARARIVSAVEHIIGGPAAQARPGDILVENNLVRFVVQQVNAGPYGGAIIDADIKRLALDQGHDRLGAVIPWINLSRSMRATRIVISDDGRTTGRAIIDVFAEDTALVAADAAGLAARINPDDPAAAIGVLDPNTAVPAEIRTRYVLEPESAAILIETRYIARGAETPLAIGDWLDVRGVHARYLSAADGLLSGVPAPGFAPFAGGEVGYNRSEFVAFVADEVSYLYEPLDAASEPGEGNSACFAVGSGVGCVAGARWSAAGPTGLATLPAAAAAAEPLVHRRHLYIGADLAAAAAARAAVRGWPSRLLPAQVNDDSGNPIAGAEATLLLRDGDVWRAWQHAWTDTDGQARLSVPTGTVLRLAVAANGHPNADGAEPAQVVVEAPRGTAAIDPVSIRLPQGATLEVFVRDHLRNPIPARVAVMGSDSSPARLATGSGAVRAIAAPGDVPLQPFRGSGDVPLPAAPVTGTIPGLVDQNGGPVAYADTVAVGAADIEGTAVFRLEPGDYTVVVSRGPAYAATAYTVSLAGGDLERILIDLPKVVDDLGWAHADLHVAADDDPRGRQTRRDRVANAAANGLHLVVAADANFVVDDQAIVPELGLENDLDVAAAALLDAPTLGQLATFPVAASATPQRTKPLAAAGEALDADTLDGGAVRFTAGSAVAAPDTLLARLASRAATGAPRLLLAPDHDGSGYFARIGLTLDTRLGYDNDAPRDGGIVATATPESIGLAAGPVYSDAWDAVGIASGRHDSAWIWHNLNTAFRLWNLGRAAPVFGASGAAQGWEPEPGTPRILARIGANAVAPADTDIATAVAAAARVGRDIVISNGPIVDFTVRAALIDNSSASVLDRYDSERGGADVADMIFVRRALFPGTDSAANDFELRVTATVHLQAPLWAPPVRVELFRNAPAATHIPDSDAAGAFLGAVTAAAWVFDDAARAAAVVPATVRDVVDGAVTTTTTGNRYEWTLTHTFVLDDAELLTAGVPDQWLAARVVGATPLYPIATGPAAAVPFAVANPVFIDLNNDAGASTFNVAYDGPCETPASARPTPIAACVD